MKEYLIVDKPDEPRVFGVRSIAEFVQVALWLHATPHVIFRGQQRDEGWPLLPGIARGPDSAWLCSQELDMVGEFKREAVPHLQQLPRSDWQWLALAQHSRLPTRLLDWTMNPLVVLWFVIKEPPIEGCPGVVWAWSYSDSILVSDVDLFKSPFDVPETSVYFPEHISASVQAQASVFTVHTLEKGESRKFVPLEEELKEPRMLAKIRIEPEDFAYSRHDLWRLNVCAATLFPGLQGIADRIKYVNTRQPDEQEPNT